MERQCNNLESNIKKTMATAQESWEKHAAA